MLKQKQGWQSILSRESPKTMIWVAVLIFAFADLAAGVPQNSISASYGFVSLDIPAPNGQLGFTNLSDIADNGDLLDFFVAAPNTPGFLLQQFRTIPIMCAHAEFSTPWGINNRGEISGNCVFPSTTPSGQGFLRRPNGELILINFPGALSTAAFKLNDNSQVVGFYQSANRALHGFIRSDGVFQTIDLPHNLSQALPRGINNLGHVVGDYTDLSGTTHGFIRYPDGSFSPIDFPWHKIPFLPT